MNRHHLRSAQGLGTVLEVTPQSAGWGTLDFAVVVFDETTSHIVESGGREVAIVPLEGAVRATVAGDDFVLDRAGVFAEMPHVLYIPPGQTVRLEADGRAEVAVGGAPAEGRYPVRLFAPTEMRSEVRGGGGATRQVNHILAYPLPAERLILFEVYVPRGGWSGWPPHCHDGYEDSPYLEETYYFRLDPPDGWAVHRNYRVDTDFNEVFAVGDRDVVCVTKGYHSSAAVPGSHMYFLNYLAGKPFDEERAIPPFFQPEYRWIDGNWDVAAMTLPTVTAAGGSRG
jgi:5-deoxy-glucuronate isomerase